jgi:tRNA-modifying protein YgfZ
MNDHTSPRPATLGATARLSDWGVIQAVGEDSATFLQGQLTNDVVALNETRWCLAGYCSAKGRLLATFVVWRPERDRFLLACPLDLLAPTLKRLSMFVLRAKCKLSDATQQVALLGLWGTSVPSEAAALLPGAVTGQWLRLSDAVVHSSGGPDVRVPRVMRALEGMSTEATEPSTDAVSLATWRAMDVQSGVPMVQGKTVDAFVPQMINFELLRGVDFRKGCYPGQEVVARSQYRGTLKRRMHLFVSDASVNVGDEVFHASDAEQPVGSVVNAAAWDKQHVALVSLKSAVLQPDGLTTLHLGSAAGPAMRQQLMPYSVPAEAQDP